MNLSTNRWSHGRILFSLRTLNSTSISERAHAHLDTQSMPSMLDWHKCMVLHNKKKIKRFKRITKDKEIIGNERMTSELVA